MSETISRPIVQARGWVILGAPLLIAAVYLVWRIRVEASLSSIEMSGRLLTLSAVLAGIACVLAARRRQSVARRPWLFVGAACVAWIGGYPVHDSQSGHAFFGVSAGFVLFVGFLTGGVLLFGRLADDEDGLRKLILDLMPPVIALLIVIWLAMVGPFVLDQDAAARLRVTALLHGAGAGVLLVLGLAGLLGRHESAAPGAPRLLLAGVATLAIGDALWLQQWVVRTASPRTSTFADVAVCIGFAAIALSALRDRRAGEAARAKASRLTAFTSAWQPQLAHFSLMVLLTVALVQAWIGEVLDRGLDTAIVGSLAIVGFVMARQAIAYHREHRMQAEIGQLSEQIDGLISQVERDPLTGLLNHRAVHDRLDQELVHARSCGHPVAVVLIDVDNFKAVNDTWGHQAGDDVLRAVASILVAASRGTDVAARYAGDEFMLLLPGLNESHAAQVCERIADDVRRVTATHKLGSVRVSLSIGAAVTHRSRRTTAHLVAIADAAMYDAKEGGKDRVVVVNADTLVPAPTRTEAPLVDVVTLVAAAHRYDIHERRDA